MIVKLSSYATIDILFDFSNADHSRYLSAAIYPNGDLAVIFTTTTGSSIDLGGDPGLIQLNHPYEIRAEWDASSVREVVKDLWTGVTTVLGPAPYPLDLTPSSLELGWSSYWQAGLSSGLMDCAQLSCDPHAANPCAGILPTPTSTPTPTIGPVANCLACSNRLCEEFDSTAIGALPPGWEFKAENPGATAQVVSGPTGLGYQSLQLNGQGSWIGVDVPPYIGLGDQTVEARMRSPQGSVQARLSGGPSNGPLRDSQGFCIYCYSLQYQAGTDSLSLALFNNGYYAPGAGGIAGWNSTFIEAKLAAAGHAPVDPLDYTLKLEMIGNVLNSYIDGVFIGTVTDSTLSSGTSGVTMLGTGYIDWFHISSQLPCVAGPPPGIVRLGASPKRKPEPPAGLTVAPNPAQRWAQVFVHLPQPSPARILFNALDGRLLLTRDLGEVSSTDTGLDLSSVAPGLYLVTLEARLDSGWSVVSTKKLAVTK
jgi:hypothetical protein